MYIDIYKTYYFWLGVSLECRIHALVSCAMMFLIKWNLTVFHHLGVEYIVQYMI